MSDALASDFVADGQPFENPAESADTAYAATTPSLGAKLGADVGEGLTAALARAAQRGQQSGSSWFDRLAATPDVDTAAGMVAGGQDPYAQEQSPTISGEDADKRFAPAGVHMFDGPVSEGLARVMGQQKTDEIRRESVLSRFAAGHGFLANTATGLLLSPLMDPVGTAALFVPGIGDEAVAAHLGEGLIARTAARAAAGASAGAVGMAAVGAAKYALGTEQDSDYSIRDALYDLAGGAALGALGHAGFGTLREAGFLAPDGLMTAERARADAGLPPAEAPTGVVSSEDLGAVVEAPATARFDALNAGVAQVVDGRSVDVAPIFDQVRAERAEAELRSWTAQQGRLDAQSTAALRTSTAVDAAAGTIESRAAVLQSRLDDLRAQHAGFLAGIETAETRRTAQADTVTPARLQAIDAELGDAALPAARRTALEDERALLTQGRDTAADTLEAARTEAELQGLQRGAAAVQAEMDRTAGKVAPLQEKAAARRLAGANALEATSDRIGAQEDMLRALAARSIRRYAGAFAVPVTRDEADALARRALRGGAEEAGKVVAEIRGRALQAAPVDARALPPGATRSSAALTSAGPPIDQQRAVIGSDVERQLVAAGRPRMEARAAGRIVAAHYEARASRFGGVLGTAEELYRQRGAEIRGPDAAPAPAPLPAGGGGAADAAAAPDIYDRTSITSRFTDEHGFFDMGRASDAVRAEIAGALDQGRSVTYHVEGRSIPIVSAENGRLVDDKGQAWGLMQVLQPRPGDANRIEVGPVRGQVAPEAAPIGETSPEPAAEPKEIAPGEPAAPVPEVVEQIAAKVLPEAVEPVRAVIAAEDEIRAVAPVEDGRPAAEAQPAPLPTVNDAAGGLGVPAPAAPRALPAYAPDTVPAAPRGEDIPAGVFMFDPLTLAVDAERFQFKSGGDAQGVTAALRGVTRWDPAKAQSVMVWEQADGRLFVADGHQRAGLARRLTEQGHASGIDLPGVLYRERDGVSAEDARAIAAVTNIANGSGSALDGAKVLRARPDLLDGSVPLSAGKGQQAAALARLGDDAFRMVVNEVVPEHFGAIVGQMLPDDAARQVAALKAIARFEPRSVEEATALTQRVAQAELVRGEEGQQGSLFGDVDEPESTAGEEMKIVGRVIRDLRRDRGLFSRVVANASRLEAAGSTIAREAARSAATDAGAFAKVLSSDAYTAGPTRTALIAAARDLRDGHASIGDAAGRLLAAVRRQAEEDGADRIGARFGDAAPEGDALGSAAGDRGRAGTDASVAGQADVAGGARPAGPATGDAGGPGRSARVGQGRDAAEDAADARRATARAAADDGAAGLLSRLTGEEAPASLFQRRGDDVLGSIASRPGERPLLRLMAGADTSTFIHEAGHDWLDQMMRDAVHSAAPETFRADAEAVRTWLGNDGGTLTEAQHEKFAAGFEQYLRGGVAPAPELAGAFAQFRDWLTRIYRTMRGLGAEISPDIRGVFDRLLTPASERPVVPARPDVAGLAQAQQEIYRAGFAAGLPQADFDALDAAVYGAKAPAASETRGADPAGTSGSAAAGAPERTAADATLAAWQQRFEAAGVVPTAEERSLIQETAARLEAADRAADGYAQAGECLAAAGV